MSHRVALEGFSAFERSALASCFRLSTHRSPRYELVAGLADSEFVVADADHGGAIERVQRAGRLADTVFVGSSAPVGASAWMMRPIDPLHVLRELDAMVSLKASARLPAVGPQSPPARPPQRDRGAPLRRASDPRSPVPGPAAAPAAGAAAEALLVAGAGPGPQPVQRQLEQLGLRTERVRTADEALGRLADKRYDLVVLESSPDGDALLDGLVLCQHIKRQATLPGMTRAPAVLLLAERPSEVDRARGSLAGCDAFLRAPVEEHELVRVLAPLGLPHRP